MTRRGFLTRLAAAGGAILAACGKDPTPELRERARTFGAPLDCSDVALLVPAEVLTRTSNEYRQHTDRADQFCLNCLNYVPPAQQGGCGTCTTVKGPINPDGWCKQWTQKRA